MKLVLGTMTFGEQIFGNDVTEMIRCFMEYGFSELDTAFVYNEGMSEKLIGEALKEIGREQVRIATKVNPRITGKLDGEAAYMQLNESLRRLGTDYVDTFYLHFPDQNTPVESVLEACAGLYKEGKFRELGLSNFPAWLAEDINIKCRENGWMRPCVYEGLYNPLSRRAEGELKKLLDETGMCFYAYNPLAGGILTNKYSEYGKEPVAGRFTYRPNYQKRYWKESYFEAAGRIRKVCEKFGIHIVEATYRWLAFHSMLNSSKGDAIIIGASRMEQLKQNIEALKKGTLPEEVVQVFEEAWEISKNDAPEYFRFYTGK